MTFAFYGEADGFFDPAPAFFGGAVAIAESVPFGFSIALAGRPYLVDLSSGEFGRLFEPRLRDNVDQADQTGEATVTISGLWRRKQTSWHRGAGQKVADAPDSDPDRFYTSRRVDPWAEKGELRLLRAGSLLDADTAAEQHLVTVGPTIYWSHGTGRDRYDNGDPPTVTALTAATGTITSIATDGRRVWFAQGDANVIQYLTYPSNVIAAWTSGGTPGASLVGYGKGRVLAARTNGAIYDISGTPAVAFPAAHFTHPSGADFVWVGFADGPNHVYAAGYVGNRSHVYRMTLNAAGTALDQPVECGSLPDGERIRCIEFYLGLMYLGTDAGVRVAQIDGAGDLVIGALIPTNSPVLDFEGEGAYVWATNTAIDASTSGLMRLNPQQFFDNGAPAYANDVEGGNADAITGVASLTADGAQVDDTYGVLGRRVWCQTTEGLFIESTTPAATGMLETGTFAYGLPVDTKRAMKADLLTKKVTGGGPTVVIAFSADDGAYATVGTHNVSEAVSTFGLDETSGYGFGLRMTLTAAANVSPEVRLLQMRAFPSPTRGQLFQIPIVLGSRVADQYAVDRYVDVRAEVAFLEDLAATQELVSYQEGTVSRSVVLEDVRWMPESWQGDEQWDPFWNGIALVAARRLAD